MFDLRYNWMIHFYKRSSFLRYTASPKPATSRLGGARYISCAQSGFFCISVSAGVFLDIGDAGLNKVTGYRQAQREGLMTDGRNTTEVVVGNDKCHCLIHFYKRIYYVHTETRSSSLATTPTELCLWYCNPAK